jgi:rhamnogalacturonyl hydrolase YesR
MVAAVAALTAAVTACGSAVEADTRTSARPPAAPAAVAAAVVQGTMPAPRFSDVAASVRRAVDYYRGTYAGTTLVRNGWSWSTYFDGVMRLYRTTGDADVLGHGTAWGRDTSWTLTTREDEANELKAAHDYADLAALDPTASLASADARMRSDLTLPDSDWWWVDALFMAMPTMALWARRTGDPAYLDAMDRRYGWTKTDGTTSPFDCTGRAPGLYDPAERLWYRDCRFVGQLDGGQKVFWGRGNGWVAAAMAETLEQLPPSDPRAQQYVTMLRDMASRLRELQGSDGMWRTSLLNPTGYPVPETSGTAMFAFAIARGITLGVLDRDTYAPVVLRAWDALTRISLQPSGFVTNCQNVGDRPGTPYQGTGPRTPPSPTSPGTLHVDSPPYCVGAFVMAGAEVARLTRSLSTGRPVVASAQQAGNEAPRLADGDMTTRWSAKGYPQSATIDLGREYRASNSLLVTLDDRAYQYRVMTSLDGTNWTTVVDKSANTTPGSNTDAFAGGTIALRYARIAVYGVSGTTTDWISIREFSVHDRYDPRPDLARSGTVAATSATAANPPRLAIDGTSATYWVSGALPTAAAPQIFLSRLAAASRVSAVRLFSRPGHGPRTVEVSVRPDGGTWTPTATATLPDAQGPHLLMFPAVTAREVRIRITGSYDAANVQLQDFEVFGP